MALHNRGMMLQIIDLFVILWMARNCVFLTMKKARDCHGEAAILESTSIAKA